MKNEGKYSIQIKIITLKLAFSLFLGKSFVKRQFEYNLHLNVAWYLSSLIKIN